jgi:cathepsin X
MAALAALTAHRRTALTHYRFRCFRSTSLSDRIKIARGAHGVDIGLSIQFLLNCGPGVAGSCHGGSSAGAFDFIEQVGYFPFDTCLAYEACSAESSEGACGRTGNDYTCSPMNTCRTCSTFAANGGFCSAISVFPNATVAEYGRIEGEDAMKREIFARGALHPVFLGSRQRLCLHCMR